MMAAGVSLVATNWTDDSSLAAFDDILPAREIFIDEARKFLALKLISAWKTLKNDSTFAPDPANLKSIAQLVHCRFVVT